MTGVCQVEHSHTGCCDWMNEPHAARSESTLHFSNDLSSETKGVCVSVTAHLLLVCFDSHAATPTFSLQGGISQLSYILCVYMRPARPDVSS